LLAVLSALAVLPVISPARALDAATIMTGSPGSTYIRFGQDIAALVQHFGVALEVVPSQGGLENIEALIRGRKTELGIVPSDVLDFIASFPDDPELRRRALLMQVVSPLHSEEVHILARPEIAAFSDLEGRRVAVGAPDSGTLLTAIRLLGMTDIQPAEELRIGDEEALTALREGRIDAMIHVAGQPAALFKDNVAIEDALHLVPVDHPALRNLYPFAAIPAGTYYPWQPKEVPTVAPQAVLMTLRWVMPYEEEACRLVGKIARIVADNIDRLRREGHPKWRELDLDAKVSSSWERSPCVEQALSGPEGYVLDPAEQAMTSGTPPPSPAAGPVAQEGRSEQREASPTSCSAEHGPIHRRLCEARQQPGAGP
jgi:TRAP transporter TAXI family solute receptor